MFEEDEELTDRRAKLNRDLIGRPAKAWTHEAILHYVRRWCSANGYVYSDEYKRCSRNELMSLFLCQTIRTGVIEGKALTYVGTSSYYCIDPTKCRRRFRLKYVSRERLRQDGWEGSSGHSSSSSRSNRPAKQTSDRFWGLRSAGHVLRLSAFKDPRTAGLPDWERFVTQEFRDHTVSTPGSLDGTITLIGSHFYVMYEGRYLLVACHPHAQADLCFIAGMPVTITGRLHLDVDDGSPQALWVESYEVIDRGNARRHPAPPKKTLL